MMYNLLECSLNCSDTTGSLWFYSKDEIINFNADIANNAAFKFCKYEIKLLEDTVVQSAPDNGDGILKNATIAIPVKYVSNFWRSLEMLLINSKVKLKLKWTNQCVLAAAGNDNIGANPDNIIFTTFKDTKLCVPVVTLLEKDDQKPLVETFYQRIWKISVLE